jgi:hypothetical protein
MNESEEIRRLEENISGERAPPVEIRLFARVEADGSESLSRLRDVMRLLAECRGRGTWPEDSWWKSRLPRWFLDPFQGRTIEDVMQNPDLWDFGSWLDAMKCPGWEWWSSETTKEGWTVRLQALSDPFSIGPLEYLARAAGAVHVEVQEG